MTVEAVILTHDDPEAVAMAVGALLRSGRPVDTVRIIDTAGARHVDIDAVIQEHDARVVVERLAENVGPAGGWAAGLSSFLASGADFAWLLDDDCVVDPGALDKALEAIDSNDVVQATMIERGSGRVVSTQGWCGVLVPRRVVEKVGLPNADLVWWTEDTEYLQWRIPRAGFRVRRAPDAIVEVSLRPDGAPKPAWKYYYEARNQVAYRIRTQRPVTDDDRTRRHLTCRVRWWRAARAVAKLAGRSVVVERIGRLAKLAAVGRGAFDGLRGRTGLTVPLGESDRARSATKASGR